MRQQQQTKKSGGPSQKITKTLLTRSPFLFGSPKKEFSAFRESARQSTGSQEDRERLCPSTCCWPGDGCRDRRLRIALPLLIFALVLRSFTLDLLRERERERERKKELPYLFYICRRCVHKHIKGRHHGWLLLNQPGNDGQTQTETGSYVNRPSVRLYVFSLLLYPGQIEGKHTQREREKMKNMDVERIKISSKRETTHTSLGEWRHYWHIWNISASP